MTTDTYTFECRFDQDHPPERRAGLTVSRPDDEHFRFSVHQGDGKPSPGVYLTPEKASDLADLIGALSPADAERGAYDRIGAVMVVALFVWSGLSAVSLLVSLTALLR